MEETTVHVVMQCPFFEEEKRVMFEEINDLENLEINEVLREQGKTFLYLMGKQPDNVSFETMYNMWAISAKHIANILQASNN